VTPGEIDWIEFPPSDGLEQAGRRPAAVVQDPLVGAGLTTVMVVPITGQPANNRFSGTVSVLPSDQNGLHKEFVIHVFQIRAMDRVRFRKRIGVVELPVLAAVFHQLDRLTGRVRSAGSP
jgi:mRNA-degrading endonuclease toxin of MazEF toxin-antitoxin module